MFNTLSYAKILEAAGVSRAQAEAHVQILAQVVEDDVATKQDIQELKTELKQLEYRIVIRLGAMMTVGFAMLAAFLKLSGSN